MKKRNLEGKDSEILFQQRLVEQKELKKAARWAVEGTGLEQLSECTAASVTSQSDNEGLTSDLYPILGVGTDDVIVRTPQAHMTLDFNYDDRIPYLEFERPLDSLLLNKGADVNIPAVKFGGRTALQAAVLSGDMDVVDSLLDAGADVNSAASYTNGSTPLQAAVERGDLNLMKPLIKPVACINGAASPVNGRTCLQPAAERGDMAIAESLSQNNADINAEPAASEGGLTALQVAVGEGHVLIADKLLSNGANPDCLPGRNSENITLCAAIKKEDDEMIRLLPERGANPRGFTGYLTPLVAAITTQDQRNVEFLIRAGVDVNARDQTQCPPWPVAIAAQEGNLAIFQLLINAREACRALLAWQRCSWLCKAIMPKLWNFCSHKGSAPSGLLLCMIHASVD